MKQDTLQACCISSLGLQQHDGLVQLHQCPTMVKLRLAQVTCWCGQKYYGPAFFHKDREDLSKLSLIKTYTTRGGGHHLTHLQTSVMIEAS